MRRQSSLFIFLFFFVISFVTSPVSAAERCYDETGYPSIVDLEQTEAGLVAHLGGDRSGRFLIYTEEEEWREGKERPRPLLEKGVDVNLPTIALSLQEAVILRPELEGIEAVEQQIVSRNSDDKIIWFGIGFYSGEGISGVGGIGKYDLKTKQVEIRRPSLIRDSSVRPILYDGKSVWAGTYGSYECIGTPPTHGLVRYDWNADRIESFEDKENGPCGFLVHDLLRDWNALWAATSFGLSILYDESGRWRHFVPQPDASPPMRETTCDVLYDALLKSVPREGGQTESYFGGSYGQLFYELASYRPAFLQKYLKSKPPKEWDCLDLRFLASRASIEELHREILRAHPLGSPHSECWLAGFGQQKSGDPRWRDLLLSIVARPPDKNSRLVELAFEYLGAFPGDEKAGKAIVLFLERSNLETTPYSHIVGAVRLLPTLLGKKAFRC
ncbi:MAG: hypothetical protein MPW15_07555 [Candidatus Manganitrophus sp.]|nr:hypothetical protein [Candidatus Manganitrophus sp.]